MCGILNNLMGCMEHEDRQDWIYNSKWSISYRTGYLAEMAGIPVKEIPPKHTSTRNTSETYLFKFWPILGCIECTSQIYVFTSVFLKSESFLFSLSLSLSLPVLNVNLLCCSHFNSVF
jgi:hypothetical protein